MIEPGNAFTVATRFKAVNSKRCIYAFFSLILVLCTSEQSDAAEFNFASHTITQAQGVLSQLPIPGEILAAFTPRSSQGRMARRRIVPAVGFIVTKLNKHSKNVVKFYNGRGTAEQWIKEGKNPVTWTKLSCRTFKDNQTRLQLFAAILDHIERLAFPPPAVNGG